MRPASTMKLMSPEKVRAKVMVNPPVRARRWTTSSKVSLSTSPGAVDGSPKADIHGIVPPRGACQWSLTGLGQQLGVLQVNTQALVQVRTPHSPQASAVVPGVQP